MKKLNRLSLLFLILFLFISSISLSQSTKSSIFDNGRMWTFDFPPKEYVAKTYNFNLTDEWLEKARLSALSLGGCTASFISEDGLVLTNHHCARGALDRVNKPGEKLGETGFYASTMEEERKIPNQTANQLQLIEDVTNEIKAAFESGKTDEEKIKNRTDKIQEIQKRYNDKTGLACNIVSLYNGGKYSLYGFKRYTDVRLVFAVETQIGFWGGDPDNYTYPRYNLDMAIYRIYDEDGKPLKSKNYFKWSKEGAKENEMVFVIGNPGRTNRLRTVSQLEFNRDFQYPLQLSRLNTQVEVLLAAIKKNPERKLELQNALFGASNIQKRIKGYLDGLLDPTLMARKKDFENNFRTAVIGKPDLAKKYGKTWDEIEKLEKEKSSIFRKVNATGQQNLSILSANNILNYARRVKNPDAGRSQQAQGRGQSQTPERMKETILNSNFDPDVEQKYLKYCIDLLVDAFGEKNDVIQKILKGQNPEKASLNIIKGTILNDKEKIKTLLDGNPDDILNSTDPLLSFISEAGKMGGDLSEKLSQFNSQEAPKIQLLGNAIFDVYGTQMPPDATGSLRIADGVVKGFEYNGTIAPPVTTFYGFYDRYYSHKKPDWDITDKWKNPPPSFDLSTPFNFVSTCDIIGGNSGSPVINKDQEVVGLIHDGNMESLPGDFIFLDEKNRAIAVHSAGMIEALEDIYKAERIVKELRTGKIAK